MRALILLGCVTFSCLSSEDAKFIHLSPELKIGPLFGTGITGWGMQLGLADIYRSNSFYVNSGQVKYDFLTDVGEWTFYRLGVHHTLRVEERLAFQAEIGMLDYDGERCVFSNCEKRGGRGFTTAGSAVYNFNSYVGVRLGLDVNVVSKSDTFLSSSIFLNLNSGVIFRF